MYAVIKTGGKQYRVQPGDLMVVEKLDGEPGASVAFGEVLMLGDGEAVMLGAPLLEGASVSATLIETRKGEKVKIFKKKRRQGYRRTRGHRQFESVLRVTAIAGEGREAKWDGEISLTTKAELNARSRGLVFTPPAAVAEAAAAPAAKKAAPKAKAKKVIEAADEVLADPVVQEAAETYAEVNTPAEAEAPAKKPAARKAAPKAEAAEAPAAEAKKPAAKKAAPKAEATPEKKPAAKKAAPKKDKGA